MPDRSATEPSVPTSPIPLLQGTTPGPWEVGCGSKDTTAPMMYVGRPAARSGGDVCWVPPHGAIADPRQRCDAALIAAAPSLAAEVTRLRGALGDLRVPVEEALHLHPNEGCDFSSKRTWDDLRHALEAALAEGSDVLPGETGRKGETLSQREIITRYIANAQANGVFERLHAATIADDLLLYFKQHGREGSDVLPTGGAEPNE